MGKSSTYGTPEHFAASRWGDINKRTVNGSCPSKTPNARWYRDRGIRLEMSRSEFISWVMQRTELIAEIYASGDVPSIDRTDSYKHYAIDNLQIIPYSENRKKRERTSWRDPQTGLARNHVNTNCWACGVLLTRHTFPSGGRESYSRFSKRLTCSLVCKNKWRNRGKA